VCFSNPAVIIDKFQAREVHIERAYFGDFLSGLGISGA
jgi:hypothetical protein